jgi:hypothetical protein
MARTKPAPIAPVNRIAPAPAPARSTYTHHDATIIDHPPRPGASREFRVTDDLGRLDAIHKGRGLTVDDVVDRVCQELATYTWSTPDEPWDKIVLSDGLVVAIVRALPEGALIRRLDDPGFWEDRSDVIAPPAPRKVNATIEAAAGALLQAVERLRELQPQLRAMERSKDDDAAKRFYQEIMDPAEAAMLAADERLDRQMKLLELEAVYCHGHLFARTGGDVADGLDSHPESIAVYTLGSVAGNPVAAADED